MFTLCHDLTNFLGKLHHIVVKCEHEFYCHFLKCEHGFLFHSFAIIVVFNNAFYIRRTVLPLTHLLGITWQLIEYLRHVYQMTLLVFYIEKYHVFSSVGILKIFLTNHSVLLNVQKLSKPLFMLVLFDSVFVPIKKQ